MSKFSDALESDYQPAQKARQKHPTGLEPGIEYNPRTGDGTATIIQPTGNPPMQADWDKFVVDAGFPKLVGASYEITQARAWQMGDGEGGVRWLHYFRAKITGDKVDLADIAQIKRNIKRRKPRKGSKGKLNLVVLFSDWQVGKGEGGGSAGIIDRVTRCIANVKARVLELQRNGYDIGKIRVECLGDLFEGCSGFYAMQTYQVDLTRRQQAYFIRRLLKLALTEFAELVEFVQVGVVGGNHGENREGGKANTTFGDNDDVAVVEQMADALSVNSAYDHVKFVIPRDNLTITVDVDGTILGLAHGHQFRGGGTGIIGKVEKWWAGQMKARWPVGDADILLTAHYHHFQMARIGRRWWIQNPTLDGGSAWFEETSGGTSGDEGMVSFTISPDDPGWFDNLKLIRP